jgi:hypothetical protein
MSQIDNYYLVWGSEVFFQLNEPTKIEYANVLAARDFNLVYSEIDNAMFLL